MTTTPTEPIPLPAADLEPASPEVKQYARLKEYATFISLGLSLAAVVVAALFIGPALGRLLGDWIGENRWLRLIAVGFIYAAAMELLTLPLEFWSGYILEHRYGLSTQTFLGWVWKRIKGYLIGGPLGLGLLLGLYALLWLTGDWWWVYATAGFLLVTLVLSTENPLHESAILLAFIALALTG